MTHADFVNGLYRNVLARDPDAGASGWVSYINAGATHDQVKAAFINSAEAQTFINPLVRLYEGLLHRPPDADGLRGWADTLRGGASLNSITEAFLQSPEGLANGFTAGLSDAAFVTKLYQSIGRTQAQIDADPDGVAGWVDALATLSRATVAQAFLESAENLQDANEFVTGYHTLRAAGNPNPTSGQIEAFKADVDFVERLYVSVLARDPDTGGASAWVSYINAGATHDQVKADFINSAEAQTFINPLVRLYEGLLNRAPDADGLRGWADALRGGASLNSIIEAFLQSPEGVANGFTAGLSNPAFVTKLYQSIGRTQAQIDADPAGVAGWVDALATISRATVAQAFLESAENQQNAKGFVLGWGALRAAGNPGPTTAQLERFSDTATIEQIIASADTVGVSTTTLPTGAGASSYNLSDTAANLIGAGLGVLNAATDITVTDAATVAQATIIAAATNAGSTTYSLSDTGTHLAGATAALLSGASLINATDNAATLTGNQVTDAIVGKFHGSDDLTLKASGAALAALTAATLGDADVVDLDATDNAVTLTGTKVTEVIVSKFDGSDDLTLNASGATLAALSAATLGDADVVALDATNNAVTLTGAKVTEVILGKFDGSDDLALNASGAQLAALSAATLGDADVVALDATDNAVALIDDQVTEAILGKFHVSDKLSLEASGEALAALSMVTLGTPNVDFLDAWDDVITLTAAQYNAFEAGNGLIEGNDFVTIICGADTDDLDLNGAGGAGVTVACTQIGDGMTINSFDDITDILQFSKLAFTAGSLPAAGEAITEDQLLSANNVTAAGGTGFASTHRFLYDTDSGNLFYDHNGVAGGAVQIATLTDAPLLIADNFFMIA